MVCLLVLFTGDLVHLYELTVIEDACLVLIVLQLLFLTLVFLPSFIFKLSIAPQNPMQILLSLLHHSALHGTSKLLFTVSL